MSKLKKLSALIIMLAFVAIIAAVIFAIWYLVSIGPVSSESSDETMIKLTIENGMSSSQIGKFLEKNNVIKSALALKFYLRFNPGKVMQSGTYNFDNSENLASVVSKITTGDVAASDTRITFIEGKNMRWVAKTIAENTNNTEEDVFAVLEDEEYIDSLIENYWFITDEIKDERIYYPLEGYLMPDTYEFKSKDVTVKEIFEVLLNHTEKYLDQYREEIESNSLTCHQILTLASICELEGKTTEDRAEIIGVFYNRLLKNMPLGSDVTTYYAAKVDMSERDLTKKELDAENGYNTRNANMYGKIPVGPICNPSQSAIDATLHYTPTDALYFVADSKGKVYFTNSYDEHQAKIKELKNDGLWYTYE